MKKYELFGKIREKSTKGALNQLRAKGFVPGILYGGEENMNVYFFINDIKKVLYTKEVYLLDLAIEDRKYMAIVKDTSYHPLSDEPIHIDLMEVTEDKVVKAKYPMSFNGTPEGAKEGGKVFKKLRIITLKGKVAELPDTVDIDITALELGDTLKISDIHIPNVEIIDPASTPVVGVARARAALVTEVEVEEGEEGVEGEEEGVEGAEGDEVTEGAEGEDSAAKPEKK
ncbi:MAG: 50S ribosomal protein L25 [Bacteroidetes bacterium]|nr:50S ribosomal protein L25 [Bacteroidota bacterium]MBL6962386.1 50S ribosomal protein L25 [Bacteroidota bacterium]